MLDRHYSPVVIRLLVFLSYAIALSLGGFSLAVFIVGGVSLVILVIMAVVIAYAVAYSAFDYWFFTTRLSPEARATRRKMAPPMIITWVIVTPLWIILFFLIDVPLSVWLMMAVLSAAATGSTPIWLK
jgi:hypothetical protein